MGSRCGAQRSKAVWGQGRPDPVRINKRRILGTVGEAGLLESVQEHQEGTEFSEHEAD